MLDIFPFISVYSSFLFSWLCLTRQTDSYWIWIRFLILIELPSLPSVAKFYPSLKRQLKFYFFHESSNYSNSQCLCFSEALFPLIFSELTHAFQTWPCRYPTGNLEILETTGYTYILSWKLFFSKTLRAEKNYWTYCRLQLSHNI